MSSVACRVLPAPPPLQATSRIAVVDLDWANITATDILAVMRSFDPHGGKGEHTTAAAALFL
jgi:hypothetical protein